MRRTGADWLHVPYRGCGPALQAVLAGNVPLGIVTASSALPFIQAGTLRALAVTSPQRSPLLPGVPTVAEQGLPGYALNQWHGVLAPAATPPAIVRRLNSAIAAVMRRPEMAAELLALGYDVTTSTPQEFQAVIERDIARFGELAGRWTCTSTECRAVEPVEYGLVHFVWRTCNATRCAHGSAAGAGVDRMPLPRMLAKPDGAASISTVAVVRLFH